MGACDFRAYEYELSHRSPPLALDPLLQPAGCLSSTRSEHGFDSYVNSTLVCTTFLFNAPEKVLFERVSKEIGPLTCLQKLKNKPLIDSELHLSCTVCGNGDWQIVGAGYDFEYESCGNAWKYNRCAVCGHLQIDRLPSPASLSVIYPQNYYSYAMNDSVHPFARFAKKLLDRVKFRSILEHSSRQVESYLDVGCGDGRYIQHMIDKGVNPSRARGVELDSHAVSVAKNNGLQVDKCRIEDATHLREGEFDLITMFHVIEHVARPDVVIRRLHELLAKGGILAIETPNFDSLDARISKGQFWGGYHIPRHWHIFTPESLQRLMTAAGFSVVTIKYQTGHAFWLWTLHHWLKYGIDCPRLAAFCHPLRNVPLLAIATAFDLFRAGLGRRTSAMLLLAQK